MNDATTSRLEELLLEEDADEKIEQLISNNCNGQLLFHEYFNAYVAAHKLDTTQIIKRSGVSRNYIYSILNGKRTNPGRDKVLALCIAAGMKYSEVNRGLKIARQGVLYSKIERDARIIVGINKGITDIVKLNLYLDSNGVAPLDL